MVKGCLAAQQTCKQHQHKSKHHKQLIWHIEMLMNMRYRVANNVNKCDSTIENHCVFGNSCLFSLFTS